MALLSLSTTRTDPDDVFADSRMSFGDHIEELRTYLIRAILGFLVVFFGGFFLDMIGKAIGNPNVGVGRPMMGVIIAPVETMVRDFYARRNEAAVDKITAADATKPTLAEGAALLERLKADGGSTADWSAADRQKLQGVPQEMRVLLPVGDLAKVFGPPRDPDQKHVETTMLVYPTQLHYLSNRGETLLENKQYLTTLSVTEAMVVYFKVSALCSVVLGSPWIFYQIWAFVAAGLYPHERAYVYRFLFPSITLFITGVLLCQFVVLPGAVSALLGFNGWLELDPDLRLNEWLGFALILAVGVRGVVPDAFGDVLPEPHRRVRVGGLLVEVAVRGHHPGGVLGRHHADAGRGDHDVPVHPDARAVHDRGVGV